MISFTTYLKKSVKALSLLCALSFIPFTHTANIIFDGDGVLFDTSMFHAMKEIGLWNLMLLGKSPQPLFMDFLNTIEPRKEDTPIAYDTHDNLLPQLMCDWLTGAKTSGQILNKVIGALDENTVLTNREKSVIKSISEYMFGDPKRYIKTKKVLRDGKKFVKRCKKNGHKVYILSNWDSPSFQELSNEFPKLIKLFDGVVISGDVGLMKPDPAIYSAIIEKFDLNPLESVFIDDRPENVDAANAHGIHGILCDKNKFKNVRKNFLAWEKELQDNAQPAAAA